VLGIDLNHGVIREGAEALTRMANALAGIHTELKRLNDSRDDA